MCIRDSSNTRIHGLISCRFGGKVEMGPWSQLGPGSNRINNLLESYPEKLAEAEQRLETVQEQLTNCLLYTSRCV